MLQIKKPAAMRISDGIIGIKITLSHHPNCHNSFSKWANTKNKWLSNKLPSSTLLHFCVSKMQVNSFPHCLLICSPITSWTYVEWLFHKALQLFFSFSSPAVPLPSWCTRNCCCVFGHNRLALQCLCRTVSLSSTGPHTNWKWGSFYSCIKPVRFRDVSVCGWKQTWHYLFHCPTNGVR